MGTGQRGGKDPGGAKASDTNGHQSSQAAAAAPASKPAHKPSHSAGRHSQPNGGGSKQGAGAQPEGPGLGALRDHIGKLLKPYHVGKQINGTQFREIRDKVIAKVRTCH